MPCKHLNHIRLDDRILWCPNCGAYSEHLLGDYTRKKWVYPKRYEKEKSRKS